MNLMRIIKNNIKIYMHTKILRYFNANKISKRNKMKIYHKIKYAIYDMQRSQNNE